VPYGSARRLADLSSTDFYFRWGKLRPILLKTTPQGVLRGCIRGVSKGIDRCSLFTFFWGVGKLQGLVQNHVFEHLTGM